MPRISEGEVPPPDPNVDPAVWNSMALCEPHEAAWWVKAYRYAAGRPGNRFQADAATFGDITCTVSGALDFASQNRVLGLSRRGDLNDDILDQSLAFFASHGVQNFRVEVPLPLLDDELGELLSSRHLARVPGSAIAKMMQKASDYPELPESLPARVLGPEDRDAFADVSRRAWGLPRAFKVLYSETFGTPGLYTVGAELDGELVATSSIYPEGDAIWSGYAATLPSAQGKGYSIALAPLLRKIVLESGCSLMFGETRSEVDHVNNVALRAGLAWGWTYMYDRVYFEPER
jgi:hypothetical protein